MTRDEKIKRLKALKARCERLIVSSNRGPEGWRKDAEALDQALTALRGPTREQVERMRGEWVHDPETGYEHCDKCSHTISLDDYMDKKPPLFCEMCGDAKTTEAVDIVMERSEELKR